jgi:predicted ATPase
MMRLKRISLLKDKVESWEKYPFNVPAIKTLEEVNITSKVCFFVGENGSGKSTLLEAVAAHYGFGYEGGSRSFYRSSSDSVRAIDPLVSALRIAFTKRTGSGFYLRAESFFNNATFIDEMAAEDGRAYVPYGGKSLHKQSHGESFLALLMNRFFRKGFYVLDEPEAALSPQRQLSFLVFLRDLLKGNNEVQFLIASHSPIILAFPGAQILSFDNGSVHEISYEETLPFQIYKRFFGDRENFLRTVFSELDLEQNE